MLKETPIVEYKDAPGKDENTEDGIKSHVDDEVINIEEGDRKNLDQTADKSAVIVYKRNIPAKVSSRISKFLEDSSGLHTNRVKLSSAR